MQKAGETVRLSQHLAIVRCSGAEHPDIGAAVVDDGLEDVGRVVDVFGPVERPYLAVTPADGVHLPALIGEQLYVR